MRLPTKFLALLIAAGLIAGAAIFAATIPGAVAQDSSSSSEPSAAPPDGTTAPDPLAGADIKRGKKVFSSIALCTNCHGWSGDGPGLDMHNHGEAAKLRESTLDAVTMMQIVQCGIPGTAMPYHDARAYKDDRCYGMVAADFEEGQQPMIGKTVRPQDIIDVVAYIRSAIQGKGEVTYEVCAAFYEASAAKACGYLQQ